jgi:hypothetical protein
LLTTNNVGFGADVDAGVGVGAKNWIHQDTLAYNHFCSSDPKCSKIANLPEDVYTLNIFPKITTLLQQSCKIHVTFLIDRGGCTDDTGCEIWRVKYDLTYTQRAWVPVRRLQGSHTHTRTETHTHTQHTHTHTNTYTHTIHIHAHEHTHTRTHTDTHTHTLTHTRTHTQHTYINTYTKTGSPGF